MTIAHRIDRAATPRAILLLGWIGSVLYGYPGFMTTEAADQLVDSRVGVFTDWHSPVMTELWRVLDVLVSGPAPMFVLQGALFLAGSYHLLARVISPRPAAVAAIAVLWCPPVLAAMAVICPESLLAACLISGAAAITSPRRTLQLAGLGLLLLACGLREGASIAALPIVLVGSTWRADLTAGRRLLIALAAWVVLAAGGHGLTRLLVDAQTGRRELELATRDISGILRFSRRLDASELARAFAGVPLRTTDDLAHDARRWYAHPDQLTQGPRRLFDPPESPVARKRVIAARDRLARAQLVAYLTYRMRVLVRLLGFIHGRPEDLVYTQFLESRAQRVPLQFDARHSVIQHRLIAAVRAVARSFAFRPYVYLVIAVLVLPLAAVRRQRHAAMLLASAIGHELGLMFVIASPEYRSSLWMIAAALLAVVLVIAQGAARAAASRRAGPAVAVTARAGATA